jgi:hypothetical protein
MRIIFMTAVMFACSSTGPSNAPSTTKAAGSGEETAAPAVPVATNPVISQICDVSPCRGQFSRITTFSRDGKPVVYRYEGDLSVCSHPPYIYYDAPTGKQIYAVGNHPVSGPEESAKLKAELDKVIGGLTESGSQLCPPKTP